MGQQIVRYELSDSRVLAVYNTDTTVDTHVIQARNNAKYTRFNTQTQTIQKHTRSPHTPYRPLSPMSHPLHPHSSILALHTGTLSQPKRDTGATCTHTHTHLPSSQLLCSFLYVSQVNGLREDVRGAEDTVLLCSFLPSS